MSVPGQGGHAEHVAAATGSPQKADPLAEGRDFGLGPEAVTRTGSRQWLSLGTLGGPRKVLVVVFGDIKLVAAISPSPRYG